MKSTLHPLGSDSQKFDLSAFAYSSYRLPSQIDRTHKVLIGQTPEVFAKTGYPDVASWPQVFAAGRRRIRHFNPQKKLLANFVSSISDIDDIANTLIAFQVEWNKLHRLLHQQYPTFAKLKQDLKSSPDLEIKNLKFEICGSFKAALGRHWRLRLRHIYRHPLDLRLQLLAGSYIDYVKTTQKWWKNIAATFSSPKSRVYRGTKAAHISHQNIYFVSSNTHSLLNIFTGFPLKLQKELLQSLKADYPHLYLVWQQIQSHESPMSPLDFTYFISKFYLSAPRLAADFQKLQHRLGILTIPSSYYLDINTQIFPVKNLPHSRFLDPRLKISRPQKLSRSDALIFNIDYPLGLAAYHVLSETLENVHSVKGVYVLGKAATLNSEIGDIQIPRLVFDEHSQNTYMFKNCFDSFFPFVNRQGSILTRQKGVSVLGTFLQNDALIAKYSKNNLTVIEMESGPYLTAVAENSYDQPAPKNTIVDLNHAPFDLGIINYTSDTPYSKAKNLGLGPLNLRGAEPVYLGSLAILQRIINLEEQS